MNTGAPSRTRPDGFESGSRSVKRWFCISKTAVWHASSDPRFSGQPECLPYPLELRVRVGVPRKGKLRSAFTINKKDFLEASPPSHHPGSEKASVAPM